MAALVNAAYSHYVERIGMLPRPMTDDYAEVISNFRLPKPPVWIEHYPPEATDGQEETFDLLIFSSYEVRRTMRGACGIGRSEIPPGSA